PCIPAFGSTRSSLLDEDSSGHDGRQSRSQDSWTEADRQSTALAQCCQFVVGPSAFGPDRDRVRRRSVERIEQGHGCRWLEYQEPRPVHLLEGVCQRHRPAYLGHLTAVALLCRGLGDRPPPCRPLRGRPRNRPLRLHGDESVDADGGTALDHRVEIRVGKQRLQEGDPGIRLTLDRPYRGDLSDDTTTSHVHDVELILVAVRYSHAP